MGNNVEIVRVEDTSGTKDKSVLFDILRQERQEEVGGAGPETDLVELKDAFSDLRYTLQQLNMSIPRRNVSMATATDRPIREALAKTSSSDINIIDSRKPKATQRHKTLEENINSLCSDGASTSTTDDELTMRLRTRNIAENKKTSINRSKVAVLSGDEIKLKRSLRVDNSQSSQRSDNIRTTKTSRLRAAALGNVQSRYLVTTFF